MPAGMSSAMSQARGGARVERTDGVVSTGSGATAATSATGATTSASGAASATGATSTGAASTSSARRASAGLLAPGATKAWAPARRAAEVRALSCIVACGRVAA